MTTRKLQGREWAREREREIRREATSRSGLAMRSWRVSWLTQLIGCLCSGKGGGLKDMVCEFYESSSHATITISAGSSTNKTGCSNCPGAERWYSTSSRVRLLTCCRKFVEAKEKSPTKVRYTTQKRHPTQTNPNINLFVSPEHCSY